MTHPADKNMTYMLNTNKIKQHWMMDPRWTVADKVQQFKGIIKLYEREKNVLRQDTKKSKQRNTEHLRSLRENIKQKRNELNNALDGDQQTLHNTLAEHRPLQLAYQNLNPNLVVDNLKQMNYGKLKAYDKLIFKRKQQTTILRDLKLKLAECKERADFEYPLEQKAQIITGAIQDTALKREVATTIQRNFKNILHTMKKDALYFDAILVSLNDDAAQQGACLYRTTQLGQLATEYLDDRIQDYQILEKAVKKSMKERQKSIKAIRQQVKETTQNLKYLLSTDTDTELTKQVISTKSELDLQRNIDSLESILMFIQNTTYVSQFDGIIPRMKDQQEQYGRLFTISDNLMALRDRMIKKRNHAELMHDSLSTTMAATTFQYIDEKENYAKTSAEHKTRIQSVEKEICNLGEIYLLVRVSLQQLHDLTNCVNTPPSAGVVQRDKTKCVEYPDGALPMRPIIDVDELLGILTTRYQLLINNYVQLEPDDKVMSVNMYQKALMDASNKAHLDDFEDVVIETSLVSDIELDDPTIPNRAEIKKRSSLVVQDCAKKDDDQPIVLLPLRGKTY